MNGNGEHSPGGPRPGQESGEQPKPVGITRRGFLEAGIGAAAGTVLAKFAKKRLFNGMEGEPATADSKIGVLPPESRREKRTTPFSGTVLTGLLAGKDFGRDPENLYSAYTGLAGKVGPRENVDFLLQLQRLWQKKIANYPAAGENVELTGRKLAKEYKEYEPRYMGLSEYIKEADLSIREILDNIDWDEIGKRKGLKGERLALLKKLAENFNGQDLVAYAMTEIMPPGDSIFNAKVMDWLLRNGGRDFVESLPALNDGLNSFGPYQLTSQALSEAKTIDPKTKQAFILLRGASTVNVSHDKTSLIGNQVSDLRGNGHHKAAFLFVINNCSYLIKDLKDKEFNQLKNHFGREKRTMLSFISTAHHGPKHAREAMERWLAGGRTKPFENYFYNNKSRFGRRFGIKSPPTAFKKYSERTLENYETLGNFV